VAEQNRPVGGLGLEGLLRGIGDLLHQAANISSDLRRSNTEDQKPKVESRMSVRTMDGEAVGADFFGLRELVAGAQAHRGAGAEAEEADRPAPPPERREPPIDILPDGSLIVAVVELPGAAADSIKVSVEEDMLSITASGPGLDYQAEALLPCAVADKAREQSFRNGVLELRWPRATPLT
jgi:HSP20 family molecular chaperone IbpA